MASIYLPSDGTGKGDDVYGPSARATELRRGRADGRARRENVVYEPDANRRGARGQERPAHVRTPGLARETRLTAPARAAAEQRLDGELPRSPERARERGGGILAAATGAIGLGRDERQGRHRRPLDRLDDETGEERREPP